MSACATIMNDLMLGLAAGLFQLVIQPNEPNLIFIPQYCEVLKFSRRCHATKPHRFKSINVLVGRFLYPDYATNDSLGVRLGPRISVCLTVLYLTITLLCLKRQTHTCLVGRRMRYSCMYKVRVSPTWCAVKIPDGIT